MAMNSLIWLGQNPLKLIIAMAGSAISQIWFQLPGTDIRPKLRRFFPNKSGPQIEVLQLLAVAIMGGVAAMCLLKPGDETASFLGGFTWYTTLQHLVRKAR
jgi:hypothetical protein